LMLMVLVRNLRLHPTVWTVLCAGTIDTSELKQAMESLGYKKKNRMVYQMIENMKAGEIDFDGYEVSP